MIEGGDGPLRAAGRGFGLCDGKRVAEDDRGGEWVLRRGTEQLGCPVFEVSERSTSATVPNQKLEGVKVQGSLRVTGEKLCQGGDSLGGIGLSGGGAELCQFRIGLRSQGGRENE